MPEQIQKHITKHNTSNLVIRAEEKQIQIHCTEVDKEVLERIKLESQKLRKLPIRIKCSNFLDSILYFSKPREAKAL